MPDVRREDRHAGDIAPDQRTRGAWSDAESMSASKGIAAPKAPRTRTVTNPRRPRTHRNSLAVRRAIAAEWHPTRNAPWTPRDVCLFSNKLAVWRCRVNSSHVWTAQISVRARGQKRCPICAEKALREERSLLARFPDVAAEWHSRKNGALTPAAVSHGANRKVWWRCPKNRAHVWQATVVGRTAAGQGCPMCARKRVTRATSLRAIHPKVAAEWHPTANAPSTPDDVAARSNKRFTWMCPAAPAHVWLATVDSRTKEKATGCPFCAGRRLTPARSLAVCAPEVAANWHPTKNGHVTPADVFAHSGRKVWWRCHERRSHVWQASVRNRVCGGGCPFCAGKRADGSNSLAARRPDVAVEWHSSRNGDLQPERVTPGSVRRVWWQCRTNPGHVWQAIVANRTKHGSGCPFCAGRVATIETSLLARFPWIAAEWHPAKNGRLRPADVTPGSSVNAWWRCRRDPSHEWRAKVCARTKGEAPTGCPHCARLARGITLPRMSLASAYPELAREWHTTKNGSLTPDAVTWGSGAKVWWRCKLNRAHIWCARVCARSRGRGCPDCVRAVRVRRSRRGTERAAPDPALAPVRSRGTSKVHDSARARTRTPGC